MNNWYSKKNKKEEREEKMNRIEERLAQVQKDGKKAFITYMTAGLPDMEGTKRIMLAEAEAGIDVIELGIPFSDPVADGPVIQNASYQSILKGTNLKKCFALMEELRKECQVPVVFMMYYNTILYYGIEDFVGKCAEVGVDGLIIPDLPFEEQGELQEVLNRIEDAPILLQLVSPVSKNRIPMILEQARGFVYCVSSMGVTGQAAKFHRNVSEYLKEVKQISKIPVMMGFGIRTASDVIPYCEIIDGAIVGSYFITLMEKSNYDLQVVRDYIAEFKKEMNVSIN